MINFSYKSKLSILTNMSEQVDIINGYLRELQANELRSTDPDMASIEDLRLTIACLEGLLEGQRDEVRPMANVQQMSA